MLSLTNASGTEQIDCSAGPVLFGNRMVDDVLNRTETAIGQAHCFETSALTLRAIHPDRVDGDDGGHLFLTASIASRLTGTAPRPDWLS